MQILLINQSPCYSSKSSSDLSLYRTSLASRHWFLKNGENLSSKMSDLVKVHHSRAEPHQYSDLCVFLLWAGSCYGNTLPLSYGAPHGTSLIKKNPSQMAPVGSKLEQSHPEHRKPVFLLCRLDAVPRKVPLSGLPSDRSPWLGSLSACSTTHATSITSNSNNNNI